MNYLKCSFPHVLCEHPSIRDGFLSVGNDLFEKKLKELEDDKKQDAEPAEEKKVTRMRKME